MKIECQTEHFRSAFNVAGAVAPSRTTSPIIQNVKLQADKTGVTLLGTDFEIAIRQIVTEAVVAAPGETLLPRERLSNILREISFPDMTIEVQKTKVLITAGRASWNLPTADAALFPPCADFTATNYWIAPSDQVRKCLSRTVYAAAAENRCKTPAYSAVNIDFQDSLMCFAGADDRRMGMAAIKFEVHGKPELPTVTWKTGTGEEKTGLLSVLLPAKLVGLIERSIGDSETPMKFSFTKNSIVVQNQNTTIFGRLLEGRYVNYRRILREKHLEECDLPIGAFLQAVRQAMTVKTEFHRAVVLEFTNGQLKITAASDEGQFVVEMPVAYNGSDLEIELDPQYLADYLKLADALVVRVGLQDRESAVELSTPGYMGLIAPYSK